MLYFLGQLAGDLSALNVFRYITFRTAGAVVTALFFVFLFGPGMIAGLRIRQGGGQPIREDGPASHLLTKKGTPTMGGLMILSGTVVSTLLWANLSNGYIWAVLGVTICFGAIGFYDDYLKVTRMSHKGFGGRQRLLLEFVIAGVAAYVMTNLDQTHYSHSLLFPFVKGLAINFGFFFFIVGAFVVTAAGNSVNLTDGLDGLAIVPVMIAAGSFGLIAYLVGNQTFADYLLVDFVPGTGELAVICGALIGAGLGFLWFNAPPAQIFMGDTGSLALGGALGAVAIATKHEIVLAIVGGLFVVETFSVMIQVTYFRLSGGKRIFLMAPIHHHFEKLGWKESQVVIRFWIIAAGLAMLGLATLKLR